MLAMKIAYGKDAYDNHAYHKNTGHTEEYSLLVKNLDSAARTAWVQILLCV